MSKLIRSRMEGREHRVRDPRDPEEYLTLLRYKIIEEAFEVWEASAGYDSKPDTFKLLDEFADLYEVLTTLAGYHGFDLEAVQAHAKLKRLARGDFRQGFAKVYT